MPRRMRLMVVLTAICLVLGAGALRPVSASLIPARYVAGTVGDVIWVLMIAGAITSAALTDLWWLAALGLLPRKAQVTGSVTLEGAELVGAPAAALERVRGKRIAMIFQDPSSSLNPVRRVGRQIEESLRLHRGLRGGAARLHVSMSHDGGVATATVIAES